MSAKPAHAHCHRCGAIARMDVSNRCSVCACSISAPLQESDAGWMSDQHRPANVSGVSTDHATQMARLMSAWCPSQVDWNYIDAHQAVLSAEQRDWTYVLCQLTPAEPQRAQSSSCRRVRGRRGGRRM